MNSPVSVEELQRAWIAVETGQFRAAGALRRDRTIGWAPTEAAVVVLGATGRVGASTVALAMGVSAGSSARVIECAAPAMAALADTTSAELGVFGGWRRAARGDLIIERPPGSGERNEQLPVPAETDRELTILDLGTMSVAARSGWMRDSAAVAPLVIVTVATVPGLRALDHALELTARPEQTWCAVLGPGLRRWPKPLQQSMTFRVSEAAAAGRLHVIPDDPHLRLTGPTADPLPRRVTSSCASILDQIIHTSKGRSHDEE